MSQFFEILKITSSFDYSESTLLLFYRMSYFAIIHFSLITNCHYPNLCLIQIGWIYS